MCMLGDCSDQQWLAIHILGLSHTSIQCQWNHYNCCRRFLSLWNDPLMHREVSSADCRLTVVFHDVFVCVCLCMCARVCMCVFVYVCTCLCVYVCVCVCSACVCVCMCLRVCVCVCVFVYVCVCVFVFVFVCVQVWDLRCYLSYSITIITTYV